MDAFARLLPDDAAFLGGEPPTIEDFGLIGDGRSAALVSRTGTVSWLCWPRFDSPACFAALLGTGEHGAWRIAPEAATPAARRRYRDDTLLLETRFTTAEGEVLVTDLMPLDTPEPTLVRIVEGQSGAVAMRSVFAPRFGYGAHAPIIRRLRDRSGVRAAAGVAGLVLRAPVQFDIGEGSASARFVVQAGEVVAFVLSHAPDGARPPAVDAVAEAEATARWWQAWAARCTYRGAHAAIVRRSLLTLKALVHHETGGIVAAATTSLPETLGGTRNWDYRFCWLRDSALTLMPLMQAGYVEEAQAWRAWLARCINGRPDRMRIMYGVGGERDLTEWEASWLPGYQGARPVRIGNAAFDQLQIDVYGEVAETLFRLHGMEETPEGWEVERALVEHLEGIWQQPDEGMWEVRGGRQRFTFSAIMAWVALDRAIRTAERWSLPAPLDRWRTLRAQVHETVCREGYDAERNTFVQSFGSQAVDASMLLIPATGFLPADDPRVVGTVAAIERELFQAGVVRRYDTRTGVDGLPPGESAFFPCNFWLVDAYAMQGRTAEARLLFERMLSYRNDLGLLAEEYEPVLRRLMGNFPQGFSHLALVGAAFRLSESAAGAE